MSIVITDGYQLKRKLSLNELQQFSMELRTLMEEKAIEICERLVAERVADIVDTYMGRGEEELKAKYGAKRIDITSSLLSEAYWDLFQEHKKFKKKDTFSDPEANFECKVVFFPAKRKLLALFLSYHKEYRDTWENLDLVQEYKYYNNIERPKNMTKGKWERRRKVWNEVLPGAGVPALNGMEIKCVIHMPMGNELRKEEILKHLPTLETRLRTQARDIAFQEKWEKFKEESVEGDHIRLINKVERWLRSDEGQADIQLKMKSLSNVLKSNIELEDITKPIQQF
jgi:hypothetical protein